MFPRLIYEILLFIISFLPPGSSEYRIDLLHNSAPAGEYNIILENNSSEAILTDQQYSMPLFSAIKIKDGVFRLKTESSLGEQIQEIYDIGDMIMQADFYAFGFSDKEIETAEEDIIGITRTSINTYFSVREQSWVFVVPNEYFRRKNQSKTKD